MRRGRPGENDWGLRVEVRFREPAVIIGGLGWLAGDGSDSDWGVGPRSNATVIGPHPPDRAVEARPQPRIPLRKAPRDCKASTQGGIP